MKIVKLNNSHALYHCGYPIALRFNSPWSKGANECRKALHEMYGQTNKWSAFRSGTNRPYWIGVKEEQIMTFLLLKIDLTK